MLWAASAINGYAIEASDGLLGTVSDLLFEDVGWAIRWLVVDTGNWLPGRKVLLPLSTLGRPDRALRRFPVELTMQQVKDVRISTRISPCRGRSSPMSTIITVGSPIGTVASFQ